MMKLLYISIFRKITLASCLLRFKVGIFGASKKQATLHRGILYIGGEQKSKSFCTVSDNLVHSPGAVWANVSPILNDIRQKHPGITKLHIFSDGPLPSIIRKVISICSAPNWPKWGSHMLGGIYLRLDCEHGKGIPDAIGGALKRRADLDHLICENSQVSLFMFCSSRQQVGERKCSPVV